MIANPAKRMTEAVTVFHRPESTQDLWVAQTVEGAWQMRTDRLVLNDGTVQNVDVLTVQIPEDQGEVEVATGDYMYRGVSSFSGGLRGLLSAHKGLRKVRGIRDLRGGLGGISGPLTRYASVLVLEGE